MRARRALKALGYSNVHVVTGDGSNGLQDSAPYDAILVSAAALDCPVHLMSQLRESGRMIIPVGCSGFSTIAIDSHDQWEAGDFDSRSGALRSFDFE